MEVIHLTATQVATQPRKARNGSTMSKRVQRSPENAERNCRILDDWDSGEFATQRELGEKYGLTQGAISQIIHNPNSTTYYAD